MRAPRIHSGHRALLGFPTIDPTGAGALRLPFPSGSFFYSFRPSLLLVVRPVMLGGSQRATWPWRSCLRSPTWTTHVFHCFLFLISIFPITWCKCYYFFFSDFFNVLLCVEVLLTIFFIKIYQKSIPTICTPKLCDELVRKKFVPFFSDKDNIIQVVVKNYPPYLSEKCMH